LPLTTAQARTCLMFLQAIIFLVFGPYHPWRIALSMFLQEYSAREVELETIQTRDPQYRSLVPALIVRWVQVRWSHWLDQQWYAPGAIPVPNLLELFSAIVLNTNWEPTIPATYLQFSTPPSAPPAATPLRPPPARSPPAARTPVPSARAPQVAVRNESYVEADFGTFRAIPIRVREILDANPAAPPPVSSYDSPEARPATQPDQPLRVCLSYHVKGMCSSGCGRHHDHRQLTPAKRVELLAWCREHYHL
jgi:hypothetical protein